MTDDYSNYDEQQAELNELYDRLLFDEEYQNIRLEALKALPGNRVNLLSSNDQDLISNSKPPNWISKQISEKYAMNYESHDVNSSGVLNKLIRAFTGFSDSHPFLSSGSFVTTGFLCGILLNVVILDPEPTFRGSRLTTADFNQQADAYFYGIGVQQNYDEALKLYREAASKGSSVALYKMATMYSEGLGVEVNKEEASRLFKKAHDK